MILCAVREVIKQNARFSNSDSSLRWEIALALLPPPEKAHNERDNHRGSGSLKDVTEAAAAAAAAALDALAEGGIADVQPSYFSDEAKRELK